MDVATTTGWLRRFRLVRRGLRGRRGLGRPQSAHQAAVESGLGRCADHRIDDGLTIAGFDFGVSAEVRFLPNRFAQEQFGIGRLLSDITRALPAKPVEVGVEGSRMLLTCGSAKFSLPAMPVEDYRRCPLCRKRLAWWPICSPKRSVRWPVAGPG